MIPGFPGAAIVGYWMLLLAVVVGGLLLTWWLWRLIHALRGKPRPALSWWQWVLAVFLSIYPIFSAVLMGGIYLQDWQQQKAYAQEDRLRHLTLKQDTPYGEIVLPKGSHVEREIPEPPDVEGQPPNLRGLRHVRFVQPVQVNGAWVQAISTYPPLLELAQPHRFAAPNGHPAQDCKAGEIAQFKLTGDALASLQNLHFQPPEPFEPSQWLFDTCFLGDPIRLRYWQDNQLVWTD